MKTKHFDSTKCKCFCIQLIWHLCTIWKKIVNSKVIFVNQCKRKIGIFLKKCIYFLSVKACELYNLTKGCNSLKIYQLLVSFKSFHIHLCKNYIIFYWQLHDYVIQLRDWKLPCIKKYVLLIVCRVKYSKCKLLYQPDKV